MSDQMEDNALSLEDLFRSPEFGRPRVQAQVAQSEAMFFGGVPPGGPLVPLAVPSMSGAVGHATTTHSRRNRTLFAAVSGVAAVLLVGVGVVSNHGSPPKRSANIAINPINIPPFPVVPSPTSQPSVAQGTTGGTGATAVSLATHVVGASPTIAVGPPIGPVTCTGCGAPRPVLPRPVFPTPTATAPTPPAAAGGALTPAVQVVGHAVTTVGATASTAATGLTVTLPPLSPVTGLVGSLGGTLANLGNQLGAVRV